MDGIELECRECGIHFLVCRTCWRGQRYCSEFCIKNSRLKSHRKDQRRYAKTESGKLSHKKRQRKYRLKKNETDQTTKKIPTLIKTHINSFVCMECGSKPDKIFCLRSKEKVFSFRREFKMEDSDADP